MAAFIFKINSAVVFPLYSRSLVMNYGEILKIKFGIGRNFFLPNIQTYSP